MLRKACLPGRGPSRADDTCGRIFLSRIAILPLAMENMP
jgi:hypothetical protein